MMKQALPFNWFDMFLLLWLTMGIFRGRKHGMSEELLIFLQWIITLLACAFTYGLIGDVLSSNVKLFGRLSAYVISYLLVAAIVGGVFMLVRRALHGKLVGSDAFGKAEYYLGMPAGMVRFLCVLLCGLALLNARLYTKSEVTAMVQYQEKEYGKEYFPGLYALQASVFETSFTGPYIRKYLRPLLITPTKPQNSQIFKQKEWSATP